MTSIHDIAFLVAPAALWTVNRWVLKRPFSTTLLFLVATAVCYSLALARVKVIDAEISADLATFDLDRDGGFSDGEMTPEAQRAMDRFAHDTGRRLAPITGGPIAAIWVGISFGLLRFVERTFGSFFPQRLQEKHRTS